MATLNREQVKQIIQNAPEGTTPEGILQELQNRGHVIEGLGGQQQPQPQAQPQQQVSSPATPATPQPNKQGTFLGNLVRGALKPAVTLAARPFQAVQALAGATPEEQKINLPFFGEIDTVRSGKDVVRDVGRGLETVALGVGAGAAGNVARQAVGQGAKQAIARTAVRGASPIARVVTTARNVVNTAGRVTGATPFGTGIKAGAVAGGLSGTGQSAAQQGQFGVDELLAGAVGAGTGAALGGVIGGAGNIFRGAGSRVAQRVPESRAVGPVKSLQQAGRERTGEKLTEKVMPQLTAKAKRVARAEGRVIEHKGSTLFGTKPATILPDKATKQGINTLQRRIPNAHRLNASQIANASEKEIGRIAQKLKPQMQRVRLSDDAKSGIRTAWTQLRKRQQTRNTFEIQKGSVHKNMQKQFDEVVKLLGKNVRDPKTGRFRPPTLDDLWTIAKQYDEVMEQSIKSASEQSSVRAQLAREMWLENRRLVRDVLKSTSKRLGKKAQQSFSDMTDLYTVRTNIVNRTSDIATKRKGGIISPRTVLGTVLPGGGLVGGGFGLASLLSD